MASYDDLSDAMRSAAQALQNMADAFGSGDKWMSSDCWSQVDPDWGQYADGLIIDVTAEIVDDPQLLKDGSDE